MFPSFKHYSEARPEESLGIKYQSGYKQGALRNMGDVGDVGKHVTFLGDLYLFAGYYLSRRFTAHHQVI
jgi:hypothetical protein